MTDAHLDPRWEWAEIPNFGSAEPGYIPIRCRHLDVVDVEGTVAGERKVVSRLCQTCDTQFQVGDYGAAQWP